MLHWPKIPTEKNTFSPVHPLLRKLLPLTFGVSLGIAFFARRQAEPPAHSGGETGTRQPSEIRARSRTPGPLSASTTLEDESLTPAAAELSLRIARLKARSLDLEAALARSEARLPTEQEAIGQLMRARAELEGQRVSTSEAALRVRALAAQRGHALLDAELFEGGAEALWKEPEMAAARSAARQRRERLQSFEELLSRWRFTVNPGNKATRVIDMPPTPAIIARAREQLAREQSGVEGKLKRFRKMAAEASIPLNSDGLLDAAGAHVAIDVPATMKAWEDAAEAMAIRDSAADIVAHIEIRDATGPLTQKW